MAYYDGVFTTASQTGPRRPSYPFGNTAIPDVYPRIYDREMMVLPASYSPAMATRTTPTNYFTYSESFANAAWTKTNVTSTDNGYFNPATKALTAGVNYETVTNGEHSIAYAYTATAASHVMSIYARADGRDYIRLKYTDSAAANYSCFFNLAAGTVGTAASSTGGIIRCDNSYYLVYMVFTPAAGAGTAYYNFSTDGATVSYAGDTARGIITYGAQMERASTIGAYIATTTATRTGSAPTWEYSEATEGSDVFAFLVNESDPTIDFMMGRFTRRYARVPGAQIRPSSKYFDRPSLDDVFSGSSYGAELIPGYSHVFTTRKTVTSFAAPDVPNTANINNGSTPGTLSGSVTISFTGNNSTQTFASNASDSTIQNALSTAVTGSTASAANFNIARNVSGITVSVVTTNTTVSAISSDSAAVIVTPLTTLGLATGGTATDLFSLKAADVNAASIRSVSATAHGGVKGDRVVFWNGDKIVGKGDVISAATDSFTVDLDVVPGKDFAADKCGFSTDADACYVNGPKVCTVRYTTNFYLPGVTAGITTYADIPTQTIYTDPKSWLGRIIAVPTGYATIEVSDVQSWQGPILMQEICEIQMDDAIDTVTP